MDRTERNRYLGVLAQDISTRFGTPIGETKDFVRHSRINDLLDERPEFVDHISVETWSKEVYSEMQSAKK